MLIWAYIRKSLVFIKCVTKRLLDIVRLWAIAENINSEIHIKFSRENLYISNAYMLKVRGLGIYRFKRNIWAWAGVGTWIAQLLRAQASDLEIRGSNPGPGSNFSLENLI